MEETKEELKGSKHTEITKGELKRAKHIEIKVSRGKKFSDWYDKHYKWLLLASLLIMIAAFVYLGIFYSKHGDIMYKDVTLSGGSSITVYSSVDIKQLEKALEKFSPIIRQLSELQTGKQIGFTIETTASYEEIKPELEKFLGYQLTEQNSSVESTGSTLSKSFYMELIIALIVAFFLMSIVVFVSFRTFIPSIAVMQAALVDMLIPLVFMDIIGYRISTAGIAAFLMMVGYSVDTDIMLTNRALRKKELSINERLWLAFKTGLTMSLAAFGAVFSAFLMVSRFSPLLSEVFLILSIGALTDILTTWLGNAAILKWYCEKKHI